MPRLVLIGFAMLLVICACQGPQPTLVVMVVTATPTTDTPSITEEASAEVVPNNDNGEEGTETEAVPTATATTPPPTPNGEPTPTISEIQVAEQVFENGRMMWLSPTNQIWVMILDEEGSGLWKVYEDTFEEGDPEDDPTLEIPEGKMQPTRGFGKLWRDNPDIREALGWATTPEFGYISRYEYHPGRDNGPGYHILFSLYGEAFRFNESGDSEWTWQLN
jgi:hypothetical protein